MLHNSPFPKWNTAYCKKKRETKKAMCKPPYVDVQQPVVVEAPEDEEVVGAGGAGDRLLHLRVDDLAEDQLHVVQLVLRHDLKKNEEKVEPAPPYLRAG